MLRMITWANGTVAVLSYEDADLALQHLGALRVAEWNTLGQLGHG